MGGILLLSYSVLTSMSLLCSALRWRCCCDRTACFCGFWAARPWLACSWAPGGARTSGASSAPRCYGRAAAVACGVLRPDDDPDVRAGATTTARGVRARPRAGARARAAGARWPARARRAAGAAVPVLRLERL